MTEKAPVTLKDRVGQFISLRDAKAALVEKHKEELKPYDEAIEKFETYFKGELERAGATNMAFETGTIYQSIGAKATVKDGEVFRKWIMENNAFQYADIRANKTTVRDLVNTTGNPPPGVDYSTHATINARRPGAK